MKRNWLFIADLANLRKDFDEEGATENIKNNISFRGTNFWTLIFAIIVASVGLNVNSTAVIIGAMLISPLMGPIVGAGFAIGTNDFSFLKRSIKNLFIAVLASVLTATLYFVISPLDIAQSELLARTQPSIYDVLIAFVGGAAGIVAATRKDRISNVIPGVAIATALMPPLCTVGFGIANGEPKYFLGAFFLFLINSVYIGLSTFLFVKLLNFKKHKELDIKAQNRVNYFVYGIASLILIPSLYLGWLMIRETMIQTKVNQNISSFLVGEKVKIIKTDIQKKSDSLYIEVTLIGSYLANEKQISIENKLRNEVNPKLKLLFVQGINDLNIDKKFNDLNTSLKSELFSDLIRNSEKTILKQRSQIDSLKSVYQSFSLDTNSAKQILKELQVQNPKIVAFSYHKMLEIRNEKIDTVPTVILKSKWRLNRYDKEKMRKYLLIRMKLDTLVVINE